MVKLSKGQTFIISCFILLEILIGVTFVSSLNTGTIILEDSKIVEDVSLEHVDLLLNEYKYNDAITELKRIISENPSSVEAYLKLSLIYMDYKDNENALSTLNLALTNKLEDDRILVNIADIKYKSANWAEALDIYYLLYKKDNSDPLVVIKYLNGLMVLNEEERLKETLFEIKPINSDVIFYRNILTYSFDINEIDLLEMDLVDISEEQASIISNIKENTIDPVVENSYILGLSQIVYYLLSSNYPELALQFDRKLINENSFFEKPNLYAGSIYTLLNAPDHAIAHINRCLKYNPESIPCHILMIENLYMQNNIDKLNENIPILLELLSEDVQDQAFFMFSILDEYKDYSRILNNNDALRLIAPNYYKEIDYISLKAAFFIKDIDLIQSQILRVSQFENILTSEEQVLYLSAKELLKILTGDEDINIDDLNIIINSDPSNFYVPLVYYTYYSKQGNENMMYYKQRAIELDLNRDIPDTFYL